jgi:hypothetical protein
VDERRCQMSTNAAPKTAPEPLRSLVDAANDVRSARSVYVAEQQAAWKRYVAAVDHVLAEDLGLDATEDGRDTDFARQLLDEVRGRVDDLRLQAHLGRMELDDLAGELRRATTALTDGLRRSAS